MQVYQSFFEQKNTDLEVSPLMAKVTPEGLMSHQRLKSTPLAEHTAATL